MKVTKSRGAFGPRPPFRPTPERITKQAQPRQESSCCSIAEGEEENERYSGSCGCLASICKSIGACIAAIIAYFTGAQEQQPAPQVRHEPPPPPTKEELEKQVRNCVAKWRDPNTLKTLRTWEQVASALQPIHVSSPEQLMEHHWSREWRDLPWDARQYVYKRLDDPFRAFAIPEALNLLEQWLTSGQPKSD